MLVGAPHNWSRLWRTPEAAIATLVLALLAIVALTYRSYGFTPDEANLYWPTECRQHRGKLPVKLVDALNYIEHWHNKRDDLGRGAGTAG